MVPNSSDPGDRPQSPEEGGKTHEELLKEVREVVRSAREAARKDATELQEQFQEEQFVELDDVLKELTDGEEIASYAPERILKKGLRLLGRVEERAFLIRNVLESVKNSGNLSKAMRHYHEIGLVKFDPKGYRSIPKGTQMKDGPFLKKLWSSVKKVVGIFMRLIVNAVRTGGHFVGVSPSVGLAAGFPTLSFAFDAHSPHLKEVLDSLVEGL